MEEYFQFFCIKSGKEELTAWKKCGIFTKVKCKDGEVFPFHSLRECAFWCKRMEWIGKGRPGAVFLNIVGKNGSARYSSLSAPITGNSGGTAVFRPESLDSGYFLFWEVIGIRCPFCVNEMERGFLQGGNLLVWTKKRHYLSLLTRDGEVELTHNYLVGPALTAWICKDCKKVIADYSAHTKGEE